LYRYTAAKRDAANVMAKYEAKSREAERDKAVNSREAERDNFTGRILMEEQMKQALGEAAAATRATHAAEEAAVAARAEGAALRKEAARYKAEAAAAEAAAAKAREDAATAAAAAAIGAGASNTSSELRKKLEEALWKLSVSATQHATETMELKGRVHEFAATLEHERAAAAAAASSSEDKHAALKKKTKKHAKREVGRYKLNPVVTHSLKAPGFNP
jgi:hypothetical protein